jgi:DNA helicase-2/ATP-dependent DNA helicase PcrA
VNAANSLIKNNQKQIEKKIWTSNQPGEKILIYRSESENSEGQKISQSILENKEDLQLEFSDFAILYRTNAQSRAFEESLRKLGIPYRIFGGLSFYKRKEIKDLIAYFRLTINHNDEEALKRVINYPARGLGQTTLERIISLSNEKNVPLWEIVSNPRGYQLQANAPTLERLIDFSSKIASFGAQLYTANAYELAFLIAQSSGIIKDLQEKSTEEPEHLQNAEALLNAIQDFVESEEEPNIDGSVNQSMKTLDQFLGEVSLMTDLEDNDKNKDKEVDTNKVSLMTIHSAKGLEFPMVYIVGLEENLFPSFMSLGSRSELEEERRLFYVALTRAKQKAVLSYAEGRMRWGQYQFSEPSRFIEEIDSEFTDFRDGREKRPPIAEKPQPLSQQRLHFEKKTATSGAAKPTPIPSKPNLGNLKKVTHALSQNSANASSLALESGQEVMHEKFGKGKVISIEGAGSNKKAVIFFENYGEKTLLLQFAKLIVL